jgi:ABC-type polysaccharide/polyol phosphate transport system ATPase subunit
MALLYGINGAGKTSTFRMITGEFAPSSGDTRVLVTGDGRAWWILPAKSAFDPRNEGTNAMDDVTSNTRRAVIAPSLDAV